MIRKIVKKISGPFLKYGTKKYVNKPRPYAFDGVEVMVKPGVFPPQYTLSTKILLNHIKSLDLKKKNLLELGCGCGIISLYAAKHGAVVTASDINNTALSALIESSMKNDLILNIIASDLFENIKENSFDYVIINPPYYAKDPSDIKEQAWFCGKNYEYFKKLFKQLSERSDKEILMVLPEDCNINNIKELAVNHGFSFISIFEKKSLMERNYIFKLER